MAARFLYIVAAIILIIIGIGFYAAFQWQSLLTPDVAFKKQPALAQSAYAAPDMWLAREGEQKLVQWRPDGFNEEDEDALNAATFFIHPTSYLASDDWNAPLDDAVSQATAQTYVRSMGSVFERGGTVWAPKYRQASIGAFLTDKADGKQAIDMAYRDVALAFDHFLAKTEPSRPIILAGHSQGSLHLMRLLEERADAIKGRIIAAYIIGWPVGIKSDLPALPLPACSAPKQTGCILSWQSFAEPADYSQIMDSFSIYPSRTKSPRKGDTFLCNNPLLFGATGSAGAEQNFGTLKPSKDLKSAEMIAKAVPAKCDETGVLLIGSPPDLGPFVLPGNNYHVYDYALFWRNIRADVEQRVRAF